MRLKPLIAAAVVAMVAATPAVAADNSTSKIDKSKLQDEVNSQQLAALQLQLAQLQAGLGWIPDELNRLTTLQNYVTSYQQSLSYYQQNGQDGRASGAYIPLFKTFAEARDYVTYVPINSFVIQGYYQTAREQLNIFADDSSSYKGIDNPSPPPILGGPFTFGPDHLQSAIDQLQLAVTWARELIQEVQDQINAITGQQPQASDNSSDPQAAANATANASADAAGMADAGAADGD